MFVGKTQNIYFCFIIIRTPLWAYQELHVFRSPRAHYDLNKSFEHVYNDLIARRAQYGLSAIVRDNGVFYRRVGCPQRALGDLGDCLAISRIYEQELTTILL